MLGMLEMLGMLGPGLVIGETLFGPCFGHAKGDFPRPSSALIGAGMSRMPAAEVKVPSIPSPLQRHVKHS